MLAHPERYWGCSTDQVAEWRRVGAVIQTDTAILLDRGTMGRLAHAMLVAGQIDLLASDNHGDRRSLVSAARWLEELGAREHAELLTRENPRRVLAGEPVVMVPPLRLSRGPLARLRDLLTRR